MAPCFPAGPARPVLTGTHSSTNLKTRKTHTAPPFTRLVAVCVTVCTSGCNSLWTWCTTHKDELAGQDAPAVALQRAHAGRCGLHRLCNGLGDGLGGVANAQADDLGVWVLFLVRATPPCNLRARHGVLETSAAGTSTWNTAGGGDSSVVCTRWRRGNGRTPLGRDSPPAASRSCHCAARRCTLHARASSGHHYAYAHAHQAHQPGQDGPLPCCFSGAATQRVRTAVHLGLPAQQYAQRD